MGVEAAPATLQGRVHTSKKEVGNGVLLLIHIVSHIVTTAL